MDLLDPEEHSSARGVRQAPMTELPITTRFQAEGEAIKGV